MLMVLLPMLTMVSRLTAPITGLRSSLLPTSGLSTLRKSTRLTSKKPRPDLVKLALMVSSTTKTVLRSSLRVESSAVPTTVTILLKRRRRSTVSTSEPTPATMFVYNNI